MSARPALTLAADRAHHDRAADARARRQQDAGRAFARALAEQDVLEMLRLYTVLKETN